MSEWKQIGCVIDRKGGGWAKYERYVDGVREEKEEPWGSPPRDGERMSEMEKVSAEEFAHARGGAVMGGEDMRNRCECGGDPVVQPVGCKGFGWHQYENKNEWDDHAYWSHRLMSIRPFRLRRGKGFVGSGVVLPSGRVFFEWRPPRATTGMYADAQEFASIHVEGHEGTHIVWLSPEGTGPAREFDDHPFGPHGMKSIAEAMKQESDHAD
jgi:hypothetical protein